MYNRPFVYLGLRGRIADPLLGDERRLATFQPIAYGSRNNDPLKQCRQDIDMANEEQIVDGTRVRNNELHSEPQAFEVL